MPHRFDNEYKGSDYVLAVKIDLPKFESCMNPDEFIQ